MIRELLFDTTVMSQFIANPHFYAPRSFNLHPVNNAAEVNEVAAAVRNTFFGGQHPSEAQRFQWTEYQSDMQFNFGIDRTIRYHAPRQAAPLYYYKFSFDGGLNMVKRLLLLTDYDGAVHGDVSFFFQGNFYFNSFFQDIFYLFNVSSFPMPILPGNVAIEVRRRLVRMWANFARTSNPTPAIDGVVTAIWPRYTVANQEFMDIRATLVPGTRPYNGRLDMWSNFQQRFNPW